MLFSSEQVSAGHPDKLCDQISDAILTDCLSHDHQSRVAIETMIKDNHVTVAGELTSAHEPDVRELVHRVLAAREPPPPTSRMCVNWFTGYWLPESRRSGTTLI